MKNEIFETVIMSILIITWAGMILITIMNIYNGV